MTYNNKLRKGINNAIRNKRDYEIIKLRMSGMKLDDVGKKFDITRERVRQLELRGKNEIIDYIEKELKEDSLKKYIVNNKYIDKDKLIKDIGKDNFQLIIYSYKTKNKRKETQLAYTEFIETLSLYDEVELKEEFKQIKNKCKSDYKDDIIKYIQKEFKKKDQYFNDKIIITALRNLGYDIYGDFILRKNINLGESIRNEVKYNYKDGIKTSDKDEINGLKDKIINIYNHKNVKARNIISRIQQSLYLWDASTYTHEDNMYITEDLEDDIIKYIECVHKKNERISYRKIYEVFEDEIKENSNFKNHHSLHGHLSRLSNEREVDFVCIKFYVCKKGTENNKSKMYFKDVVEYLKDKTHGADKEEIKRALPDFDHNLLRYTSIYYPQIVRWNNGKFLNLDAIKVSDEDKKEMIKILEKQLDNKFNYTSKYILYNYYEKYNKELLERLTCLNDKNKLFDLNKYYFSHMFVFNQPHIVKKSIKDADNFTSEVFANQLIENNYTDNHKEAIKKVINIYKDKISINDIEKIS